MIMNMIVFCQYLLLNTTKLQPIDKRAKNGFKEKVKEIIIIIQTFLNKDFQLRFSMNITLRHLDK